MKGIFKIVSVLIVLACMGQMLIGCHTEQKNLVYESCITDVSNSEIAVKVDLAEDLWPDPDRADSEAKSISQTCRFTEQDFTGEFLYATSYPLTPCTANKYRTKDGVTFALDREGGELRHISFINSEHFETEHLLDDVPDPENTAIEIATQIAEKYIKVSDYEQTVAIDVLLEGTDREIKTYVVEFTKYIQGYITRDRLSVTVTSKGNIAAVSIGYIGGFDDIPFEIDRQKATDSAVAAAKKIYADLPYTIVGVKIGEQTLAETQKGEVGVHTTTVVELKNAEGHTFTAAISVFTFWRYE